MLSYDPVTELTETQAREVLRRTRLCKGRPVDLAFVRSAICDVAVPRGTDLRRHGTQLAPIVLKALGLRTTTILTAEFLDVLTEEGRADPVGSAAHIVSAYLTGASMHHAARRAEQAGIEMVTIVPTNTAAGPCTACLALAEKPISIRMAPIGPLRECPHPTQCRLHVRSVLRFD